MTTYEQLRHFADSWFLVVMAIMFVAFVAWPFRRAASKANEHAAQMIFNEDDSHGGK